MTNPLDTLRPEVRDALDVVADDARCVCSEAYTSRDMKDPACNHDTMPYIETIRAELLRLANENAQLRDVLADRDMDREMAAQANKRTSKAEAELAALKARIEGAPTVEVPPTIPSAYPQRVDVVVARGVLPASNHRRRVHLVVED